MISLNMVHIAPWGAALGLLAGAGRLLRPDGVLFLYGPFMLGRTHTAASNAAFDADLKRRDPRWVRDVDALVGEAATHGLELREVVEMRVNNLSLVFVRRAGCPSLISPAMWQLGRVVINRHHLSRGGECLLLPPIADVWRARSKSPLSARSRHPLGQSLLRVPVWSGYRPKVCVAITWMLYRFAGN